MPTCCWSRWGTLMLTPPPPQSTVGPDHRFRLPRVRQANIRDDRQRIVEPWREVGIGDIGRPQALTADDLVRRPDLLLYLPDLLRDPLDREGVVQIVLLDQTPRLLIRGFSRLDRPFGRGGILGLARIFESPLQILSQQRKAIAIPPAAQSLGLDRVDRTVVATQQSLRPALPQPLEIGRAHV